MKFSYAHKKKRELELKDHCGKRKRARPLVKNHVIHLILKARYVLHSHEGFIEEKIQAYAKKFAIKVHDFAIANDHIHFAIEIPNREYYKKFVRALTGIIARKMGKGTWRLLPYTRVVVNRIYRKNLLSYVKQNREETRLERAYKTRKYSKKDRLRLGPPATLSPNLENALR